MANDPGSQTRFSLLHRLKEEPDNQNVWGEFVDRYAPRIYAWCAHWRLQDADARDVTQDVLLKLAEKMRSFTYDPARSFRAWLKTLTRHAWSDFVTGSQHRLARGTGSPEVGELLSNVAAGADLANHLKDQFDLELLEEARLRVQWRVDPTSWDAFRLTALENVPGAEAACALGLSVAALYKAKSRVLKMLQNEVQEMERAEA
jgi:RNA polymerase sigma factor (sigma-70 family)